MTKSLDQQIQDSQGPIPDPEGDAEQGDEIEGDEDDDLKIEEEDEEGEED